jgi:hypothetical protein
MWSNNLNQFDSKSTYNSYVSYYSKQAGLTQPQNETVTAQSGQGIGTLLNCNTTDIPQINHKRKYKRRQKTTPEVQRKRKRRKASPKKKRIKRRKALYKGRKKRSKINKKSKKSKGNKKSIKTKRRNLKITNF